MRLIAYTRVSTDEQAERGHSLAIQPAALINYASAHGIQIVRMIADEGVSGSVALARRKGGNELLAMLAEGAADGVLVTRLDRLFRDALDGLSFFAGTTLAAPPAVVSANENIDTSTPKGRMQLTMTLAMAQYERDMAAARAADNTRGMRDAGKVYGTVPYGCTEVGATAEARGRLVRDPQTWLVREQILAWRDQNVSYSAIADRLRSLRIPAPGGGRAWSKSTLRGIVDTHDQLAHLPLASKEGEGAPCLN